MQDELRYKEYRNEFPINTIKAWGDTLSRQIDWTYTGWSGEPREPFRHWSAVLDFEDKGLLAEVWQAINVSLKEDGFSLKPRRILANLYSHGDSSWLHTDSHNSRDWTIILYLNDFWDVNWGGETVIVEKNEILHCCAPTPGKFFLFRSDLLHGPRPVSREAPYPRFGLTYQCESSHSKILIK